MADSDIVIVTVVRDWMMYDRCLRLNRHCAGTVLVPLDNSKDNLAIPVRYNCFLESYNFSHEAWFVFCHEDFEFLEDLSGILAGLDRNVLYGPIGHVRVGMFGFGVQSVRGEIRQTDKRGADLAEPRIGRRLKRPMKVDTFDCCCFMVHSSLIKRFGLRFDDRLEFDLYVEDFCAAANLRFHIPSYAVQMEVCHHSDMAPTERLWRHLPYLKEKYPNRFFTGTLTYFGTDSWQKRIQDYIVSLLTRRGRRINS